MFAWAMAPDRRRRFGLRQNPVLNLTPRLLNLRATYRDRFLSRDELRAYLLASEQLRLAPDRTFAKCLLLMPRRLNELSSLKWSDVDLGRKLWSVPGEWHSPVPKAQVLSDAGTALLEELRLVDKPAADDFVFGRGANNRGPKNRSRMKKMIDHRMKSILGDAGIEFRDWRWNDLRRTVFELLVSIDVSYGVAQLVVGRAPNGLLELYPHGAVRAALERLAEEIAAIRDGKPAA